MGIEADPRPSRRVVHLDPSGAWAEVVEGVLRIDPALDGMAFEDHIALADRELLAGSDEDLLFHQVDPRDLFGDGMLDLNALVDL